MNLNKTQIDALANKFYNEIKNKLSEKIEADKIKQLAKYKANYEKGIKLLKENLWLDKIEINLNKSYAATLRRTDTFEDYCEDWSFEKVIKISEKQISKNDIKNDIILATIDSTSVDDIMKILKTKYNK